MLLHPTTSNLEVLFHLSIEANHFLVYNSFST